MHTNLHHKLATKWIAFGSVLTAVLLMAAASSATADTPTKFSYSFTADNVITDPFPFPVNIHSVVTNTEIDYFDKNGILTRSFIHVTEQDTFTANGKTLVGLPYTTDAELLFDGNGNLIHYYVSGNIEKIPLPDGTLFISAGRYDFADFPPTLTFVISTPEKGNPGNLAALIAALSP